MSTVLAGETRLPRARLARRLAGPTVSLLSLAAVVWWALHQHAPHLPSSVGDMLALALALLVYACVTVLRGLRWQAILRAAGVRASMADTQALIVVGYMGNTVLPARGGEVLRVILLGERTESSRVSITGTIVAERLLDVFALLVLLLLLAFVTASGVSGVPELTLVASAVLVALALALLAARKLSHSQRLPALSRHVDSLTRASRSLLGLRGLLLALLTAVLWAGEGCIYWLVGRTLQLPLDFLQASFLVVLSSLAAAIPAAPGYAGTYDAAIQLGLRALHVRGGPALAFGLLVRMIIFLPITLAGLVLVLVRYGGLASLREVRWRRAPAIADEPATIVGLVE